MQACPASTLESGALRVAPRLSPDTLEACFEGYRTKTSHEKELKAASIAFCQAMCSSHENARWLSLVGSSGTGKTLAAKRITRAFSRHCEGLLDEVRLQKVGDRPLRKGGFLSWPDCIECMLERDYGFMRQACEDWFLVLDDVGAEHEKLRELSVSKLFSILNARQNKFTVLTCNFSLQQIAERMDPRIASRLIRHGGVVIDCSGAPDFAMNP